MLIKQLVDDCLGNSSYLLASEEAGLAVVIDPQRDVDKYLRLAEGLGLRLTYALDTHLHADFITGVRELAHSANVVIGASEKSGLQFEHTGLKEGNSIQLGELMIGVLETPGHTPEHISYTVGPADDSVPKAIFTGGALIVGGAARTDLLGHDMSRPLARKLYNTLHNKLMQLPDDVEVYPTHGAGSFCVVPVSSERVTTIGLERKQNRLLKARNENEFVELALSGLPSYPVYYSELRAINQRGPRILGGVPEPEPVEAAEVKAMIDSGVAVLDIRSPAEFAAGHIPDSYGINVNAPVLVWAGWLIPFGTPLVLVTKNEADRQEAVRQLIRIGYDDIRGYLAGGVDAWAAAGYAVEEMPILPLSDLHAQMQTEEAPFVLDVRQQNEWDLGHIPGATLIENGRLAWDDLSLPTDRTIAVHCAHDFRAAAGASVLVRRGYKNVVLMEGGFARWQAAKFEVAHD